MPKRQTPWRRSSGSAARPAMKRSSGSAARPATHSGDSSAERPAHHASHVGSKRFKCGQLDKKLFTSVAYLSFPELPRKKFKASEARRCVIDVLKQAKAVDADVINIVFQRAADMDLMWDDLQAEMKASDEHPAFSHRRLDQLLTLFSTNCGELVWDDVSAFEDAVPTISLTLRGPSDLGNMLIINAACPRLPQSARTCMLGHYSDYALEEMNSISLIGGELSLFPY